MSQSDIGLSIASYEYHTIVKCQCALIILTAGWASELFPRSKILPSAETPELAKHAISVAPSPSATAGSSLVVLTSFRKLAGLRMAIFAVELYIGLTK
jgi:hypothetical protein